MMKSMKRAVVTKLAMVGLIAVGSTLVGCGTGPKPAELMAMDAETAYERLAEHESTWQAIGDIFSSDENETNIVGSLANREAELTRNLIDEMEAAASNAGVPQQAMIAMVEEVSGYMLEALPRDARRRGVDDGRLTVAMGRLVNDMGDPNLDGAMDLIRSNLAQNTEFQRSFRLAAVAFDERDEIMTAVSGADWDILTNPGGEANDVVAPEHVYAIAGRAWYTVGDQFNYKLDVHTVVEATHMGSRGTAAPKTFTRSFYYHPAASISTTGKTARPGFISAEENERRRQLVIAEMNADN